MNDTSEVTQAASQEAATPTRKKTEVTPVTMTDGRVIEFAGNRKLLKSYSVDGTEVSVKLDFRNGEVRNIILPDSLLLQFAGHGALQKYGDETAGCTDIDDMVLSVDKLDDRIQKGEWTQAREGGGLAGTSVLMQALMEASGKTKDEVKAFLEPLSQKEKLALRMSKQIKPIIDKIEAEKATKSANVDTEALLGGLGV